MASNVILTTNEGEVDFNFDSWITDNQLDDIKAVFIKHNAVNKEILTFTSQEIKSVMTDQQLLTKPYMIPKIMDAIQKLPALNQQSNIEIIKITITEEEENVIGNIENNLNALNQMEQLIDAFKTSVPQSELRIKKQQLKQLDGAAQKVNKLFQEIDMALIMKKQSLLKEIENMKANINKNDESKTDNNDEKENDIILSSHNNIRDCRKFLQEKLKICDELTSTNNDRIQRKNNVINIGKEIMNKFTKTQKILTNNFENINKKIAVNNDTIVDINFIIDQDKYKNITANIENIGHISNLCCIGSDKLEEGNNDDSNINTNTSHIAASVIMFYRYENSKPIDLGTKGAAIVPNKDNSNNYSLLVYEIKNRDIILSITIHDKFNINILPKKFISFYDSNIISRFFSMRFPNKNLLQKFVSGITMCKAPNITLFNSNKNIIFQDLNSVSDDDKCITASSNSIINIHVEIWQCHMKQHPFRRGKSVYIADKQINLASNKIFLGLSEGLKSIKQGTKRLILLSSHYGFGSKGNKTLNVAPNSPLIMEVTAKLIIENPLKINNDQ